jgi:hypothetical protein
MAGLPWIIVFAIIAAVGLWRGWAWVTILSIFCIGVGAADTDAGDAIYSGAQGLISGAWDGVVSALNSVAA